MRRIGHVNALFLCLGQIKQLFAQCGDSFDQIGINAVVFDVAKADVEKSMSELGQDGGGVLREVDDWD